MTTSTASSGAHGSPITKERGVATAAAILAFTTTLALATGAVVSFACHSLGITFA
jgi:hypothetical protein